MKFARIVYYIAGIYGIIALFSLYFMEAKTGRDYPPAITHPEFYYGFVGIGLAFQLVFLIIARNPAKYRALMPVTVSEKLVFVVPTMILYFQNRLALPLFAAGLIDLVFGLLFVAAFLKTEAASEN
jgi:glucan phosphoethanolaminetransferase (alkaline phosphatase superfamily)